MAKNGTAYEFVVFFIPFSARQILGMELSNNFITQDELYWPRIETGEYSTKSAYASQQHQNDICSVTTLLYLCVFFSHYLNIEHHAKMKTFNLEALAQ